MSNPGQQQQPDASQIGQGQYYFAQDFYIYNFLFGAFATNATVTVNTQIQSDSDFEWIESTYYGNMTGATAPFQNTIQIPVNIQIIDSGSAKSLFSAAVPITAIAGTGPQAFVMPVTRIFKANSNIQVVGTSFDGTNAYANVSFNMIGRKLFRTPN